MCQIKRQQKRATLNLEQKKKKDISGFPKTAMTNAHSSGFNDQASGRYPNS